MSNDRPERDIPAENASPIAPANELLASVSPENFINKVSDSARAMLQGLESGPMKTASWTHDAGIKAEAKNVPAFTHALSNMTRHV